MVTMGTWFHTFSFSGRKYKGWPTEIDLVEMIQYLKPPWPEPSSGRLSSIKLIPVENAIAVIPKWIGLYGNNRSAEDGHFRRDFMLNLQVVIESSEDIMKSG